MFNLIANLKHILCLQFARMNFIRSGFLLFAIIVACQTVGCFSFLFPLVYGRTVNRLTLLSNRKNKKHA